MPFILEDGQIVGRLVYERLTEPPQTLYGAGLGSNYQAQGLKLSKHFKADAAPPARSRVDGRDAGGALPGGLPSAASLSASRCRPHCRCPGIPLVSDVRLPLPLAPACPSSLMSPPLRA